MTAQEVLPPDLQKVIEDEFTTKGLVKMVVVSFDVPLRDAGPQPF